MCGICGIISHHPILNHAPVQRMQDYLTHRGPDGAGEYRSPHVSLAMRRLSIIDLEGGWQPLYNEDRSIVLIVNGEIYNYKELQNELRKNGHSLSTNSDCEVIAHLYEDEGIACLKRLRGMFALALFDTKRQIVFLARDRMGEKPLFIFEEADRFIFSSELKSLFHSRMVPFNLNPAAIDLYFHYQFVPEPMTLINNVTKLDAGTYLEIDLIPWTKKVVQYWRMEDSPEITGDPIAIIREELERTAEIIIRSDVPIAISLSGGVDSSVIAKLTHSKYPGTIHAISLGYGGKLSFDERPEAKQLAEELGMPYHEVEVSTDDAIASLPELVHWLDEPIADPSAFCYHTIMKKSRELGCPVILQGHGGDELFFGYPWLIDAVTKTEAERAATGNDEAVIFYELIQDFMFASQDSEIYYAKSFKQSLIPDAPYHVFRNHRQGMTAPVLITKLIMDTYLRSNGIAQGDRLSMASSVELRLPFVDYVLVEQVIGLRKRYPDHVLPPKTWLKEAVKDILPDELLNRKKRGFQPPYMDWYRGYFKHYGEYLRDGVLVRSQVITPEAGKLLAIGTMHSHSISPFAYKALLLELWCRLLIHDQQSV